MTDKHDGYRPVGVATLAPIGPSAAPTEPEGAPVFRAEGIHKTFAQGV